MELSLEERKKLVIQLSGQYVDAITNILPKGKELRLVHRDGTHDVIFWSTPMSEKDIKA